MLYRPWVLLYLFALTIISLIKESTGESHAFQVESFEELDNCTDICSMQVNLSDTYSTQAEGSNEPSRMATHVYALTQIGVAAIEPFANLAS